MRSSRNHRVSDDGWRCGAPRVAVAVVLLLASCARTGFVSPVADSGATHLDRPAQEGLVLDVTAADRPLDAALADVLDLDARADATGIDLGVVDTGPLDPGALDVGATDPGSEDTASPADAATDDTATADAAAEDTAGPDTAAPPDAATDDTAIADTAVDDTAIADTTVDDTAAPDTAQPDTSTCGVVPPWWDPAWGLRRPLRVDETVTGSLAIGYSVVLRYDSRADVSAGNSLTSGDDLRVVRWDGATWTELDRHLRAMNTATTELWFKTQAAISASDASYWLYLNNPAPGAPPAAWADSMAGTSAVYLAADNFEDDTIGQAPGGWEGAGDYTVQSDSGSQVLRVVGTGNSKADYFFAGDHAWTDVAVQGRLRVVDTSGQYYGLFTRVEPTTPFDTLWWGLYDNNSLQLYELAIANPMAESLSGSGSLEYNGTLSPAAGTTWHTFEVRLLGRNATLFYDGAQQTTHLLPPNSMQAGRIGLCAGYVVSRAYWDDIIVRAHVDPEPTVSVSGVDEPACP